MNVCCSVSDCKRQVLAKGYCNPHYYQINRRGKVPGPIRIRDGDDAERFWTKVDKSGECWLWQAACDNHGYGCFWFGGRLQKSSRVSWSLAHGDPGELFVLHRCDNPRCVNPEHLFLGTQQDNLIDMRAKGRGRGPYSKVA